MRNATEILMDLELTTGQVAWLLGVTKPTINKWCKKHGLPHTKHGSHHRIVLSELRAWLERFMPHRTECVCKLSPTARARIAAFIEGAR